MSITLTQISPRILAHLGADHVAWVLGFGDLARGTASSRATGQWDANSVEGYRVYLLASEDPS